MSTQDSFDAARSAAMDLQRAYVSTYCAMLASDEQRYGDLVSALYDAMVLAQDIAEDEYKGLIVQA